MAGRLGIIAGEGYLPAQIQAANPDAFVASFEGINPQCTNAQFFAFEHIGALFTALQTAGCRDVCFAGAMVRPRLDPSRFDAQMHALAPKLMAAIGQGDDALLKVILSAFIENGFQVLGAHQVAPELLAPAGKITGPDLQATALSDIDKGVAILKTLAPHDLGQGCIIEAGLCLGIETLQGTDFMLKCLAKTPAKLRKGRGVFVKMPKLGQELRLDMPAIGPDTIENMHAAGLGVLAIAAGKTLMIARDELMDRANKYGITIIGMEI